MKEYTNEQIETTVPELIEAIRDELNWFSDLTVKVESRTEDYLDLRIAAMYERPMLTFKLLDALAKFFDTLNIETESEFSSAGCATCDWSSEYGFVLRIRNGDPWQETTDEG